MIKESALGLPSGLFASAFPFHIVFDQALGIVQIGATLQRVHPAMRVGEPLTQALRITRPTIAPTFAAIQAEQHTLFLLEASDRPLRLRGQMIYSAEQQLLYFLGSPWVTSTAELAPLGLAIQDFAIHDPIIDLLVLIQSQQSALADMQKLTTRLKAQREQLRQANNELAAQAHEQQQLHEEIVQLQAAALEEMSTPLIPLTDRVMVMPLVGSLDSKRIQRVLETLLHGIQTQRAQIAILDITGVALVDTRVAQQVIQIAQTVRLLGAQMVITGVRPEVAQALVGLGVELTNIVTYSSLQQGVRAVLAQRRT